MCSETESEPAVPSKLASAPLLSQTCTGSLDLKVGTALDEQERMLDAADTRCRKTERRIPGR